MILKNFKYDNEADSGSHCLKWSNHFVSWNCNEGVEGETVKFNCSMHIN